MAIHLLPVDEKPINRERHGVLSIRTEILADLLNLQDCNVGGVRINLTSGTIELQVLGEDMPAHISEFAQPVELRMNVVEEGGERKVFASWAHLPEKKWRIR